MMDKEQKQQILDSIDFILKEIRRGLDLYGNRINGSFRATYRYTQHLQELVRLGAIIEEREYVGIPIIELSKNWEANDD